MKRHRLLATKGILTKLRIEAMVSPPMPAYNATGSSHLISKFPPQCERKLPWCLLARLSRRSEVGDVFVYSFDTENLSLETPDYSNLTAFGVRGVYSDTEKKLSGRKGDLSELEGVSLELQIFCQCLLISKYIK